jgi:hypothetical protein
MPGASKGGKAGGGQASNADLQDDEDVMNQYRRKIFGDWKATRRPKRQIGPLIVYEKSPPPPPKK